MCDSTGRYEVTGGALPALGGPQSLFILAQDAVPAGRRLRAKHGEKQQRPHARCFPSEVRHKWLFYQ